MEVDQPIERPRTSRGRYGRSMRPPSRGGRKIEQLIADDDEASGRPASRRGFTPETYERHDYDEFSRQDMPTNRPISPAYSSSPSSTGNFNECISPQSLPRPMSRDSPRRYRSPMQHGGQSSLHAQQRITNHRPMSRGSSRDHMSPNQQTWNDASSSSHHQHRASPAYRRTSDDRRHSSQNYDQYHQESVRSPSWQEQQPDNHFPQDPGQTDQHADVLSLDRVQQENWPMTPREKPPTPRPKSSRKRLKSSRKKRQEQMIQNEDANSVHPAVDTPILRPPSSLSKYRLLPAIGQSAPKPNDSMDDVTSQTQNLALGLGLGERTRTSYSIDLHKSDNQDKSDLDLNVSETDDSLVLRNSESIQGMDMPDQETSAEPRSFQLSSAKSTFRSHDLPDEPDDSETRLLLAIRLPDGRRHQRYFRVTEKLEMVLKFAENISYTELSGQRLACNAPRAVFSDLSMLIGESGLVDRTVLYLEEEED